MKKKIYIAPTFEIEILDVADNFLGNSQVPDTDKGNAAGDSGKGDGTTGFGGDGTGGDMAKKNGIFFSGEDEEW